MTDLFKARANAYRAAVAALLTPIRSQQPIGRSEFNAAMRGATWMKAPIRH